MRTPLLSLVAVALVASACSGASSTGNPGPSSAPGHHLPTAAPWPGESEPTPYDGVTYQDPAVNPYVDPVEDRVSTFALDVDTASYTIAQRYIDDGFRPDPASVRVEEWINAFDQGYAPPVDETFAIVADGGPTPFTDRDEVLLRVGLQARDVRDHARAETALTFVIDTSGSMEREGRLELVKDALARLVDGLGRDDTVAIHVRRRGAGVSRADTGHGPGHDPPRDRPAAAERLDEPGARPAARL
jgi:Ca-activated chloride channel homolog